MFSDKAKTIRFFSIVIRSPRITLLLTLGFLIGTASGLSQLVKDTSVKAFIPPGHESLLADEKAEELFGLSDPVAIAIVSKNKQSVFAEPARTYIAEITESVKALPNVRKDRVSSLTTESSISGDGAGLFVDKYIDDDPAIARQRWANMPPHISTLVNDDATSAVVLAEVQDVHRAVETYERLRQLVAEKTHPDFDVYVAGPAAISGYLSKYIDSDARKLQPLVFLLVFAFIYLAFRRARALPGPLMLVFVAAGGALGTMAWLGIPYFAITSALPVIIVAISVADAIHILSAYYRKRARVPTGDRKPLVIEAMAEMARPITLTTLTTIAGFAGIASVSIMPPITYFAWIASLGVGLAWFFTLFALPNLIMLIDPGVSPVIKPDESHQQHTILRPLLRLTGKAPLALVAAFAAFALIAINGAQELRFDRSQVENFTPDEPIRIADDLINERFSGTSFLDVIVETDAVEGLLSERRMQKLIDLQAHFESLEHVRKTVSIADYISLLHHAIKGSAVGDGRTLPDSDDAIAQYLFLYEMSGDPSDLDEEIDYGRQFAMVRGLLDSRYYSENKPTVEALQAYLDNEFNEPGMTGTLTGNVNVSYHWMSGLQASHFQGVGLSLALVLLTSIFVFRSLFAGIVAVLPVLFTLLTLYAVMGYLGIYLEPATSMFAAIALGVGVDFAIHLVDRIQTATDTLGESLEATFENYVPSVARACFFNSAALGVGFAVLMTSDLPTLQRFGGLISVATMTSYLTALLLVPALFALRERFPLRRLSTGAAGLLCCGLLFSPTDVDANDANLIAESVAHRAEGKATIRDVRMVLTNKKGRSKERIARIHKLKTGDERLTRVTFLAPKRYRNQAFLSHDDLSSKIGDKRWMFFPAGEITRTLPAAHRGRSFAGTDFSIEDVQSELKFDLGDYTFEYERIEHRDGRVLHHLSGTPATQSIARELQYGAFEAVIDEATWMPVKVIFRDLDLELLKTIIVHDVESIQGIWTATDISAENHQTGHRTRFIYDRVEYPSELSAEILDSNKLALGLGDIE